MTSSNNIPTWIYKLLLVVATILWGLSFVVMKDTVDVIGPASLIGVRFFACGIILGVVFMRRMRAHFNRDHVIKGLIIGVVLFLAFWIQTIGLAHTTPGKNAFLTATYCVIVPFAWWALSRRRPTIFNVIAAVMCVAGVGLVSNLGSLSMGYGDAMTLLCAFVFAIHIVLVAKFSDGCDIYVLTVYQFLFGGIAGIAIGGAVETWPTFDQITPDFLFNMAYLIIFASCIALLIQNVALAHVPPAQASLLLSLESVFGVLFSVILYGEEVTLQLLAGFALIFAAIVVSETFPLKGRRNSEAREGERHRNDG